jgi:hypothetical protein
MNDKERVALEGIPVELEGIPVEQILERVLGIVRDSMFLSAEMKKQEGINKEICPFCGLSKAEFGLGKKGKRGCQSGHKE